MSLVYRPPPTVVEFLRSDSFANFIIGPVGSGKTTGMLFRIAKMAKEQRPNAQGKRKFRAILVRNTLQQLMDTSLRSWLTWFPEGEAGTYERTNKIFHLRFDDVECEVWFRPLDTPDDVRRLLSVEANIICFDEFREINPDIYNAATGRVGRYPSKKDGGPYKDDGSPNFGVFGATNPPDADTFWETLLTTPPENVSVFFQPSGLSPDAENTENLPEDYYENLCAGKSQDWIDVYVEGKFGKSLAGQPVFRSFDRKTHVAKEPTKVLANAPVIIGVDAGLSPAAVIGQVDYTGRVVVHDALISESMGALRFIREKLKPLLTSKYSGQQVLITIDPAAFQRAQTDERTVADIFRSERLTVRPARSNVISARIAAVDKYLTRIVDGKPGFLVSPTANQLVIALSGKYRYKINTKGETEEKPEKSHPWSDVADALQYLCLHADGGALFAPADKVGRREVKPSLAVGWT